MDVEQVIKVRKIGGRFTHYSSEQIMGVADSATAKHSKIFQLKAGLSSLLLDLSIATSCVSGSFSIYYDGKPIIVNTVLFPLALETTPLLIGEWLEDELKVNAENEEDSERILQYMVRAIEISTAHKDEIENVLGAIK